MRSRRWGSRYPRDSSLRWRITRAPRAGASASGSGATEKAPLPSDDQRHASLGPGAAGLDDDLVGDHERRIEADAELADEVGRLLAGVFGGEPVEERAGAGAGDGAERVDEFGARHADAVVAEGDRVSFGIERDLDAERLARLDRAPAWRSPRSAASRRRRRRWRRARARRCRGPNRPNGPSVAAGARRRPRNSGSWSPRPPETCASLVNFASPIVKRAEPTAAARRRRSYREDFLRFQGAWASLRRAKKEADRRGGGPPIRQPAWQFRGPDRRSGAGGQNTPSAAPNRTIAARFCFAGPMRRLIDHKRAKLRHFSRRRERRPQWAGGSGAAAAASSPWRRPSASGLAATACAAARRAAQLHRLERALQRRRRALRSAPSASGGLSLA